MNTKILFPAIFITSLVLIYFTFFQSNAESNSEVSQNHEAIVTRVFVYNGSSTIDSARVSLQQEGVEIYYSYTGSTGKAVFTNPRPGYYNVWAVKAGLGSGHSNNYYIAGSTTIRIYLTDLE